MIRAIALSSNRTFMELKSCEDHSVRKVSKCSNRTFMELKLVTNIANTFLVLF